jgi:hypothetical protein
VAWRAPASGFWDEWAAAALAYSTRCLRYWILVYETLAGQPVYAAPSSESVAIIAPWANENRPSPAGATWQPERSVDRRDKRARWLTGGHYIIALRLDFVGAGKISPFCTLVNPNAEIRGNLFQIGGENARSCESGTRFRRAVYQNGFATRCPDSPKMPPGIGLVLRSSSKKTKLFARNSSLLGTGATIDTASSDRMDLRSSGSSPCLSTP